MATIGLGFQHINKREDIKEGTLWVSRLSGDRYVVTNSGTEPYIGIYTKNAISITCLDRHHSHLIGSDWFLTMCYLVEDADRKDFVSKENRFSKDF
jgi:hypothetical protein